MWTSMVCSDANDPFLIGGCREEGIVVCAAGRAWRIKDEGWNRMCSSRKSALTLLVLLGCMVVFAPASLHSHVVTIVDMTRLAVSTVIVGQAHYGMAIDRRINRVDVVDERSDRAVHSEMVTAWSMVAVKPGGVVPCPGA